MNDKKNNQPTPQLDKEPGKPGYKPGKTGVPQQEVFDEDAKAELQHEKNQPRQDTDESRKIVNEQEQDQVVNNDDANTQTKPAKMSEKL